MKHYASSVEIASQTVPEVDLSFDIDFIMACHRQWEIEGRGVVTFDFRRKMLDRDIELEAQILAFDRLYKWAKNGGIE